MLAWRCRSTMAAVRKMKAAPRASRQAAGLSAAMVLSGASGVGLAALPPAPRGLAAFADADADQAELGDDSELHIIIFDEIDANLDAAHRTAVANLINAYTQSRGGDDDGDVEAEGTSAQFIATTFRLELVTSAHKCFGVSLRNKVSQVNEIDDETALQFISHEQAAPAQGGESHLHCCLSCIAIARRANLVVLCAGQFNPTAAVVAD